MTTNLALLGGLILLAGALTFVVGKFLIHIADAIRDNRRAKKQLAQERRRQAARGMVADPESPTFAYERSNGEWRVSRAGFFEHVEEVPVGDEYTIDVGLAPEEIRRQYFALMSVAEHQQ